MSATRIVGLISIPDPVFEAAEELARRLRVSRSELYCRAIEQMVREHAQADVTERLNRVYEGRSSGPDSVLAQIQEVSILREEW